MLWYKAWLETRWRFLIGFAVVMCSAAGAVFTWPKVLQLMPLMPTVDVGGEIGRRIREAVELSREYRGFVWSQAFRQNLPEMATLFAVLLGTGGLLSQTSGGMLFTLSMPVSRRRLLGVRAATGLLELLAMALVPALVIPLFSPAVGETYSLSAALVHCICLFVATSVFFAFAVFLSTAFTDVWRPLMIALGVAIGIALFEGLLMPGSSAGIFAVMTGERFFRTGSLPWAGLFLCAAASMAMLYGATLNLAHRDF